VLLKRTDTAVAGTGQCSRAPTGSAVEPSCATSQVEPVPRIELLAIVKRRISRTMWLSLIACSLAAISRNFAWSG
jgi:hypothetical protein